MNLSLNNFKKINIKNIIPVPSNNFIIKAVIILTLLNLYVISHILFGVNNINSYFATKNKIEIAKSDLFTIMTQNQIFEKEISMLQKNNLDYDYLEEVVREQLNYSYKDEKVIIYSKNNQDLN